MPYCLHTKQFERATRDEGFGDGLAEIGGSGDDWSALYDVCNLVAVGGDDHRMQVMDLVDGMAIRSEGELAASAEGGEDGTLGGDGVLGVGTACGRRRGSPGRAWSLPCRADAAGCGSVARALPDRARA